MKYIIIYLLISFMPRPGHSLLLFLCLLSWTFGDLSLKAKIRDNPNVDIYPNLEIEEQEEWAFDYDSSLVSRIIDLITPLEEVIQIEVVLVGFEDLKITPASIEPFLTHLPHRMPLHVVRSQTLTSKQVDDEFRAEEDFDHSKTVNNFMQDVPNYNSEKGRIFIDRVVHYSVSKAEREVSEGHQMLLTRQKALHNAPTPFRIPYNDMDNLIQEDYLKRSKKHGPATVLLYLFHSELAANFSFHYSISGNSDTCGAPLQTGKSRWMWLDLGAGPASWGPSFIGYGSVTSTLVPYIGNYNTTAFPMDEQERRLFLTDISAWIRRTAELQLSPSVDHFPFLLSPKREPERTNIHVVTFHDVPFSKQKNPEKSGETKAKILSHLLQQYKKFPNQNIQFVGSDIPLFDHLEASSVYANSVKEYIYPDTISETGEVVYHSHKYLDSALLREWILRIGIRKFVGSLRVNVIPVFVFDFEETDLLLLDRKHLSVSFPDMVLAIQIGPVHLPYQCGGTRISLDGSDVIRPLLGNIIQTVWGVLPTGNYWNESHKKLEEDWMWSMGRTPFGPFSSSTELSFVQMDSMHRPQLYQLINQTLSHTIEPLYALHKYNFELYQLLSESEYFEFVVRWNLFRYKLREAVEMISFHEWNDSYHFIRSAHKDSEVLLKLLFTGREQIISYLECDHKTATTWKSSANTLVPIFCIIVAIALMAYLAYNKRGHIMAKKKRK